jgi:hypothetical protein
MKDLLKSKSATIAGGSIVTIAMAFAAVEALPWAMKTAVEENAEAISLLIEYRNQEQDWYNEFRERLVRIEESGKNVSKDVEEIKSDLKDHKRNHHQ